MTEQSQDDSNNSGSSPRTNKRGRASAAEGSGGHEPTARAASGRQRREDGIMDEKDYLRAMASLMGGVTTGILSPAQGGVVLNICKEGLRHGRERPSRDAAPTIGDADLLSLARRDPEVRRLIEPLLTDAQVQALTRGDDFDADQ